MEDNIRLDWLVKNRALVHTAHKDTHAESYWVVFRNGTTSDNRATYRAAIDAAMNDTD